MHMYLNIYHVWQAYGGSEEGGWWYTVGTPLASVPIPATATKVPEKDQEPIYDDADRLIGYRMWKVEPGIPQAALDRMREQYTEMFAEHHDPPMSKSTSRGVVEIKIEDEPGEDFPSERPYYC